MSRVKHLFAVVLAALMLCLLMPVAAFAEEAPTRKAPQILPLVAPFFNHKGVKNGLLPHF